VERNRTAEVSVVPDPAPDLYAKAMPDGPAAAGFPDLSIPLPLPLVRRSGIYRLDRPVILPPIPVPPIPPPLFGTEELRVDVDGVMPTMTVSGTITRLFGGQLTWIARVTNDPATGAWTGPISYRDGTTSLRPQATVSVTLTGGPFLP
jgi:hypothetical protein